MRGHLDQVAEDFVKGWAVNPDDQKAFVKVRILASTTVVAEGYADMSRPDVAAALKIESDLHGFKISFPKNKFDLSQIEVQAHNGIRWVKLNRSAKKSLPYQDFEGNGASKSHEKLSALRLYDITAGKDLVTPLKGKSVLDIGCNEGFFSLEAIKQGAVRVVGMDASVEMIKKARVHCPDAEFIADTWWHLPNEKFDVILFLSAIHYERDQKKLLDKLLDHLTPQGVLVLECGVFPAKGQQHWFTATRWDGDRYYPTTDFLINALLDKYAVRYIGPSVQQSGDPVTRAVYHCRPKSSTAILMSGRSQIGKTSLAREFSNRNFPVYSTDLALILLLTSELLSKNRLSVKLRNEFPNKGMNQNIDILGNYIVSSGNSEEFVDFILKEFPIFEDIFIIEGEILRHGDIHDLLCQRLSANNIRVWDLQRNIENP